MPMSDLLLTKRHLLGGAALAAFAGGLAAFGGTASAANATSVNGTDTTTTGATNNPEDTPPDSDGTVDMADVLKPGPLPEMALGKEDAPVKIVEYMSMTCPHCAHFAVTTFPELKSKYIDTGKVRYIIREFPFDPRAAAAFMLARTNPQAPDQLSSPEQYYAMVDMLFKQQVAWAAADDGRAALLQMSKLAGFTEDSFTKTLTNQKLLDEVNAVRERGAKSYGVNATPTFLINGKRYAGDMSIVAMSKLIDEASK
ncbi:DsbA family protein [Neorhizobium sp. P12A]|jgi:protein-disulfide isomerase|uniref:DsbA family protein n=1 Tax=Neorhizobium sp. P12A TaxID=2268027 RepID=UPI0011EDEEAE|nr:DsbA family protein [Neorhizobium sp. P12A]KAA0699780.1 DsbA family protein [Neorhizobium sp. P12A]